MMYFVYLLMIAFASQTIHAGKNVTVSTFGVETQLDYDDKSAYNLAIDSLDNKEALEDFFEKRYPHVKNKNLFDVYFNDVVSNRKAKHQEECEKYATQFHRKYLTEAGKWFAVMIGCVAAEVTSFFAIIDDRYCPPNFKNCYNYRFVLDASLLGGCAFAGKEVAKNFWIATDYPEVVRAKIENLTTAQKLYAHAIASRKKYEAVAQDELTAKYEKLKQRLDDETEQKQLLEKTCTTYANFIQTHKTMIDINKDN